MKGIMFSFVMVFFTITLISLIAIQRSLVTESREQLYLETRINSMNVMYESIIRDIKKALDIITTRAISVAISHIVVENDPLTNANETLKQLIVDGTLNGNPEPLMINATFGNWTEKMAEVGILKGFDINITRLTLDIRPYDSWDLEIETELLINITDKQGVASINRSVKIKKLVNLEGIEDPLYPLNTGGLASNFITRTPYEGNFTQVLVTGNGDNGWAYGEVANVTPGSACSVSDKSNKILVTSDASGIVCLNQFKGIVSDDKIATTNRPYVNKTSNLATKRLSTGMKVLVDGDNGNVWYIDNFKKHAESSYYNQSKNGPSYLDRLENKFEIQPKYSDQVQGRVIGLESFVNKYLFYFKSIDINESKTSVDYVYLNPVEVADGDSIKGISQTSATDSDTYFRIDDFTRQQAYNVSGITMP